MNLVEAMRKACSEKKYITNDIFKSVGAKIAPDEHENWCNIIRDKEKSITPRWQPGIIDFMDETWVVVD